MESTDSHSDTTLLDRRHGKMKMKSGPMDIGKNMRFINEYINNHVVSFIGFLNSQIGTSATRFILFLSLAFQ